MKKLTDATYQTLPHLTQEIHSRAKLYAINLGKVYWDITESNIALEVKVKVRGIDV